MLIFEASVEIPSGVAALGNSLAIAGETSPIRYHSRTRWVLTRVFVVAFCSCAVVVVVADDDEETVWLLAAEARGVVEGESFGAG